MDVNNGVVSYTRRVDALSVSCVLKEDKDKDSPYDMCVLTIGTGANQINHNNSLSSKKYEFTNRNIQGRYNRNPLGGIQCYPVPIKDDLKLFKGRDMVVELRVQYCRDFLELSLFLDKDKPKKLFIGLK